MFIYAAIIRYHQAERSTVKYFAGYPEAVAEVKRVEGYANPPGSITGHVTQYWTTEMPEAVIPADERWVQLPFNF